jgi:hypothetical protein
MARKGERYTQIPTLWHLGFDQPFRVMRKRKGEKRWTSRSYAALTRSSAQRWERLVRAGRARRRRDVNLEAMIGFGVTSIPAIQQRIREERRCSQ